MNDLCPQSLCAFAQRSVLIASAFGAKITMMPAGQWNCTGCGTINTDGATDGLPAESDERAEAKELGPADGWSGRRR